MILNTCVGYVLEEDPSNFEAAEKMIGQTQLYLSGHTLSVTGNRA
jgi:hypothetical protein